MAMNYEKFSAFKRKKTVQVWSLRQEFATFSQAPQFFFSGRFHGPVSVFNVNIGVRLCMVSIGDSRLGGNQMPTGASAWELASSRFPSALVMH